MIIGLQKTYDSLFDMCLEIRQRVQGISDKIVGKLPANDNESSKSSIGLHNKNLNKTKKSIRSLRSAKSSKTVHYKEPNSVDSEQNLYGDLMGMASGKQCNKILNNLFKS
jgi:hypothetical protein